MTPLLDARGIALHERLEPTDVQLGPGELVALIGPNGSGKTSLLRALAGVERTAGEVTIAGMAMQHVPVPRLPYLVTYLPASRDLVWPISVRDVIALGLPQPDLDRVGQLIERLEFDRLADRSVDSLSTGERGRVLLARALAPKPRLLLLDEPLSNLDPYWVIQILGTLREAVSRQTSALVAVHDIDRLADFDRAILMNHGRIVADLEPLEMLRSAKLGAAFRIERGAEGWRVRPREARQSSP